MGHVADNVLMVDISLLPVLCGLGKYRTLARFQMADDTWLYEVRDNTGRLP